MTALLQENFVRIYHKALADSDDGLFELDLRQRSKQQQLATWERPAVTGPTSANPEEIISGWAQDDMSGGFGIVDADEGVDTQRYEFGLIDARKPHAVTLPPRKYVHTKPAWASGAFMPLGDIGTQFYGAWGAHAAGFNETTDIYHTTDNNLVKTPLTEGTKFAGKLFVPCGSTGALALTELTAGTGTLTITAIPTTAFTPDPLASHATTFVPKVFCIWDSKLWAMHTDNSMSYITVGDAITSPTTLWTQVLDKNKSVIFLNTSDTVNKMLVYLNRAGEYVMWAITNNGAYLFNEGEGRWMEASLEWGAHPDFGKDAQVFRGGEDMWVAAGGLDYLRYTAANVTVPMSGPSKDQGVPAAYSGKIVSMAAERSTLYGLVQGITVPYSQEWTEDEGQAAYAAAASVPMWLACWTGTAFCALAEVRDTTATPTRLKLSTVVGGYRLWWGDSEGVSYSIRIPLDFYNPRAKVQLGLDEFEPDGWVQTIRYDANMVGWDKIASHHFQMYDYAAEDCYVDTSYRTDANLYELSGQNTLNEPSFIPWKRANTRGRTLMWFDDEDEDPYSEQPWREGLVFQWLQYRMDFHTDNVALTPILNNHSTHHVRIPQDAASLTLNIKIPAAEYMGNSTPSQTWTRLKNMQRYLGFIHMQVDNDTFLRGKLAGVTFERWAGGEQDDGTCSLIFVEIGASANAHQQVAS